MSDKLQLLFKIQRKMKKQKEKIDVYLWEKQEQKNKY
jgi:hypothetical protein